MRVKNYKLEDKLYLLELIGDDIIRLIVTHDDYNLSYELLSVYKDDILTFDTKSYVKTLNGEQLLNYLIDINDNEDDYLIKDNLELENILKESR